MSAQFYENFFNVTAVNVAQSMTREFLRKKNEYEMKKTSYKQSGTIDLSRLSRYRVSDDIFKRISLTPQGENHGMVFVIDWSGSMSDSVNEMAMQYAIIYRFCIMAGIKFKIMLFTSGANVSAMDKNLGKHDFAPKASIYEIASNKTKLQDVKKVYMDMLNSQHTRKEYLTMGGTPLFDVMSVAFSTAISMRTEHSLANMTIMYITDGDSCAASDKQNGQVTGITNPWTNKTYEVKHPSHLGVAINDMCYDEGISTINLFLADNGSINIGERRSRMGKSTTRPKIKIHQVPGQKSLSVFGDVGGFDQFISVNKNDLPNPKNVSNDLTSSRKIVSMIGDILVKEICRKFA